MTTLSKITRRSGVAGQIAYGVTVTYPGEAPSALTFVGSVYGGPIVMVTDAGQTFVEYPARFGRFSPTWVRRFFA